MFDRLKNLCRPLNPGAHCRPGQVRLDGAARAAVETGRTRLLIAGFMFTAAFALISWRLVDLTVVKPAEFARSQAAEKRKLVARAETGHRADIVDRNGVILATSLPTYSLYADPKRVVDSRGTARRLKRIFPDLSEADLLHRLKANRRFIWLRRHLTPRQYQVVLSEGFAGLGVRKERRRVYPHGALLSHVLGFTNVDNRGLSGVERYFDKTLRGGDEPLALSIDLRVQHLVHEALTGAVRKFSAIGGAAMVMDVRTGELVAMVSLPDFDPHDPAAGRSKALFNRNTLGVYEMGSTFKIFNTAMALDTGTMGPDDMVDARHPIKISRFTIQDYHAKARMLSVREVFIYSSNIGSAKMAVQVGGERQQAFLAKLGLMKTPSLEIAEIGAPLYPKKWRPINTMTVAFGHGIAVSPLQIVNAVAGVTNNGLMVPATLLKRTSDEELHGRRVVSARTSRIMRSLMRLLVEKGTGKNAEAPGYEIGGKTGTAEKASRRGYRRKALLSSFIGVFPASKPRFVVFVALDEPKGTKETHGYATAGWVAAPVVREIVQQAAPLLGVAPVPEIDPNSNSTPSNSTLVDSRDFVPPATARPSVRPAPGILTVAKDRRHETY